MIGVDTNILVYAHRSDSAFHQPAKELIEILRSGAGSWAIPWPCIHEFVSTVTHPKLFKIPTPLEASFASIDAWLAGGNLHLIGESEGYFEKFRMISEAAKLKGPRIHDARIAALCLHHGVTELWTADRDFAAFPQVKIRNPLIRK